jgi:hypothetical protein
MDEREREKRRTIILLNIRLRLTRPKSDFVPFLEYPRMVFAYFFAVELGVSNVSEYIEGKRERDRGKGILTKVPLLERSWTVMVELRSSLPSHVMTQCLPPFNHQYQSTR